MMRPSYDILHTYDMVLLGLLTYVAVDYTDNMVCVLALLKCIQMQLAPIPHV